jgi:pimeloyl-ACP methyl ester carboxylesterase
VTSPSPLGPVVVELPPEVAAHGVDVHHRTVAGDGHVTGARLAVVEVGPADAPAWVVAHGVGSSARFVTAAFARPVLAAGCRLVAYDLRGHGASDPARTVGSHHLDVHAGDLTQVVASVASSGGIALVGGVSLGGHAAVRAVSSGRLEAAVDPSHLTLLACLPAWTGVATPGRGPHAAIAAEVAAIGIPGVLARLRGDTAMPAWLRDTLVTDYGRHDQASLAAALIALDGGEAPTEAELRALPVPLAVVAWPDDPGHPLVTAEAWTRWVPTAALATIAVTDLGRELTVFGDAAWRAVAALR